MSASNPLGIKLQSSEQPSSIPISIFDQTASFCQFRMLLVITVLKPLPKCQKHRHPRPARCSLPTAGGEASLRRFGVVSPTAGRFSLPVQTAASKMHVPTIALTRMLISVEMRPMQTSQSSPRGLKAWTFDWLILARGPARAPPTSINATATIKKRVFILLWLLKE